MTPEKGLLLFTIYYFYYVLFTIYYIFSHKLYYWIMIIFVCHICFYISSLLSRFYISISLTRSVSTCKLQLARPLLPPPAPCTFSSSCLLVWDMDSFLTQAPLSLPTSRRSRPVSCLSPPQNPEMDWGLDQLGWAPGSRAIGRKARVAP